MPKVRISATRASSRVTTNTIIMALCAVGSRHGRKITQVLARRTRLYTGGSGQIHQVVEAAPVTTQDSKAAINFIMSIVFRFRVPHSIITDNGMNFTSKEFKDYCEGLGIKLKFASVAHPKTNG
jgi:transposase InsO family protein